MLQLFIIKEISAQLWSKETVADLTFFKKSEVSHK